MQANVVDSIAVDEEDEDSLFGSPPPTPIRGRSPSPALALPSASSSAQNVGTIALPGSHPYSELPVNPLASSSSYPNIGQPPRPPALSQATQRVNPHMAQIHIPSSSSCPSWSRASSAGPSVRPVKKVLKKSKSKESTPRPPGPEIALPDPSNPPPANFLRNQSALLGTAGLVGGVKPANLSVHRHTRGTNPANPIVVEDEDEPILGRATKFRHPYTHPVDPSFLPTPSTQDVVAMLIGQKDIFPVLESILRLIASGAGPQVPHPSTSSRPSRPISSETLPSPAKKRKLNRVPAGAVDWDVPYPFPQGEGPEAYRTTWERERGKQLISQLVSLIKNAARKAATRIFIQNQEAKRVMLESQRAAYAQMQELATHGFGEVKVHGHYRPSTVTYGLEGEAALTAKAQVQEVLTDASNGRSATASASPYQPAPSSSSATFRSGPQPSTPFDQLISSLLAASPDKTIPQVGGSGVNPQSAANVGNDNTNSPVNAGSTEASGVSVGGNNDPVDQGLLDSWMSILQTFPVPSEGFAPPQKPAQPSTPASTDSGTFDFSDLDTGFDFDFDISTPVPTSDSQTLTDALQPPRQPGNIYNGLSWNTLNISDSNPPGGSHPPNSDHLIDPTLMALSIPQAVQSGHPRTPMSPPPLAPSPMPSMSSFGDADPTTPNSATWDMTTPDVFTGAGGDEVLNEGGIEGGRGFGGLGGQGMWGRALRNNMLKTQRADQGRTDDILGALLGDLDKDKGTESQRQEKGKGRDFGGISNAVMGPILQSQPAMQNPYQALLAGLVTSTSLLKTAPPRAAPSSKVLNKNDILRRAKERRRQLVAEIDKVKTQLWETTIEQGALAHLSKHYS